MNSSNFTLVFVYNAESGLLNAIKDGIWKAVSPTTYQCRLCTLTFGAATMKNRWKRFIESLNIPVEFLHKDEFFKQYNCKDTKFPSAYYTDFEGIHLLVSQKEMNETETLEDLMKLVKYRIEKILGK